MSDEPAPKRTKVDDKAAAVSILHVPNLAEWMPTAQIPNCTGWAGEGGREVHRSGYNQLIDTEQVVMKGIVRNPKRPLELHDEAFVRAGPREYLHFDCSSVTAGERRPVLPPTPGRGRVGTCNIPSVCANAR